MGKTGFTIEGLLSGSVDVMSMPDKTLRKAYRTLADAGNKRLKRLEEKGMSDTSPAYRGLVSYTGQDQPRFRSSLSDTRNTLLSNFIHARNFLNNKTSTTTGTRKFLKDVNDRLPGYSDMTEEERKNLWAVYDRIKDTGRINGIGSQVIQQAIIAEEDATQDVEALFEKMLKKLDQLYEEQQEGSSIWESLNDKDSPFLEE